VTENNAEVHLICQAHIDPIWIWDWEEGLTESLATFEAAADLLDEYPEFVFNHNESLLYGWVRDYRPELFARIKAHVATGRWVIIGGWYLQPDCNLSGGESFARQILLGRKLFADEFGVMPTTACNFDSFGHHGNLPQFLKLSGYECYVHFRPLAHEKELPDFIYTWEGVDGSQVAALRPPCVWYCTHPADPLDGKIERIRKLAEARGMHVTCFWGAGNHGGGATRNDLDTIQRLADGHPPLKHGSLDDYCRDVVIPNAGNHPPVAGELQKCFTGCYTSTIAVKLRNKRGEGLALAAERYAALAWWFLGEDYPAAKLERVWEDVLFNQFHDILPGSAIHEGISSSGEIMGRAFTNAREIIIDAQLAMARNRQKKRPLTIRIFNPHPVRRRLPVTVDLQLATHPAFAQGKYLALYDAEDRPVPRQLLPYKCNTGAWRNTLLLEADLCAAGIAEYRVEIQEPTEEVAAPPATGDSPEGFLPVADVSLHDGNCKASDHTPWFTADDRAIAITTAHYTARVCRETGCLLSLVDAGSGEDMLSGPSGKLLIRADNNDAWGGTQNSYGDVVGTFQLPDAEALSAICGHHGQPAVTPAVRIAASGPLATVVETILSHARSTARIRYTFYRNFPFIDAEVLVNWNERCRALQYAFETSIEGDEYLVEIPHAAIARPRGNGEEPCGRWAMVFNHDHAFALVNNGPGGVDVAGNALRQSLVRSPTFTGGGAAPKPGFMQEHMDLGEHIFRFKISFGATDQVRRGLPLLTDDLALPASYLCSLPLDASDKPGVERGTELVRLETGDNVHLEAIKRSEDGTALIARLVERGGEAASASLTLLGGGTASASFRPYEMKTFRFRRDGGEVTATECDLLERRIPD